MASGITIAEARCDLFRLPLPEPLSDATHGRMTDYELVTVRLRCDDEIEGLGYTYTVGRGGRAIHALVAHDLTPLLLGSDATDIAELWQRMQQWLLYVGRGGVASFAISAVDVALWDAAARRAGVPLWRLLGGTDKRVAAYGGGVDLHLSPKDLAAQALAMLARGLSGVKVKVGRPRLEEDLARVAAVREALGPDVPLMVDANMRWDVPQAVEAARALAEHAPLWLEEPTRPDDFEGHARIAEEGGLAIAAGESLRTFHEFERLVASGGVAYPEPDCTNIGGVTGWLQVARLAQEHGLPVTSHGAHDLHVHLLAAVPNASYLEVHAFGLEPYLDESLVLTGGQALAPERPGHGVALRWEVLAPHWVSAS